MGIYPFGAGYYLVTALQRAGTTLEMQWSDSMGQPWNFLAGYGYSAEEQWVSAAIPDHWLPYHRMFVRALMLPQAAPATLALRKSSPEIYTTHKVQIKGVVYRLVDISPPGTKCRLYKLVK